MKSEIRVRPLATVICVAAMLSGCGGGGSGNTSSGDTMMPSVTPTPYDFGMWAERGSFGYESTTLGLRAGFDADGRPQITSSATSYQPTVSGTWNGRWSQRVVFDDPRLEREVRNPWALTDEGDVRVTVTMDDQVWATMRIEGIDEAADGDDRGMYTTGRALVREGRFSMTVDGDIGGLDLSHTGVGQFGGAEQRGVVGYASATDNFDGIRFDSRFVFYGERED